MPFATDDTFLDPGQPWDGQPTKVAPSGGIEASGFVPGQPMPAEFLNYLLSELGIRQEELALAKALNWRLAPDKDQTGLGTLTPFLTRATWGQRHLYAVNNATIIQVSYNDGTTWTTDDTLASAVYTGIDSYEGPNGNEGTSAVCACMTLSGAGRVSMRGETATWNDQALGSAATADAVTADQYDGSFWVVGSQTGGGAPGIWRVETNDGAIGGTIDTVHPTIGTYSLTLVAAGDPYKLASRGAGGAGLWRWESGDTAATLVSAPGSGDVRDIVWNAHDRAFYLCQAQGGQGSIWKSSTGASGSWTSVGPGDGTETRTWAIGGGATLGKLTVFVCTSTVLSVTFLLVTGDGGLTWHRVGDPTQASYIVERVRRCGNGLVASAYGGASMASHAFGLRGGVPL